MLMCVSVYANIVCAYYVHQAHDPAHAFTIIQSHADTIKTPPRRQGLGFSGGGGSLRRASGGDPGGQRRCHPEAGDRRRRYRGMRASGDGAPEADGRRRHTLGPMATAVVQGAVGVDSGHEVRGSLWRSRETRLSLAMAATRGVGGSGVLRRPTPPVWRLRRRPLI